MPARKENMRTYNDQVRKNEIMKELQFPNKQNELLRSAYQIVKRKGAETNWQAIEKNLRMELLREAGWPDSTDEQTILRATCTPLTYRIKDEA